MNPEPIDEDEKRKCVEAAEAERRQFTENRAVDLVRAEEGKIQKESHLPEIIRAPMRYVRTIKKKDSKALEANTRLIISGQTDPEFGLQQKDAPTTIHVVVIGVVPPAITESLPPDIEIFVVMTAFLSGEMYTKAPPEDQPAAEGWKAVKPYQ